MKEKRSTYYLAFSLGIYLFPVLFILDLLFYPDFKWSLLTIRLAITAYLIVARYVIVRIDEHRLFPMTAFTVVLSAIALTLTCFVTGDGFASPYYTGFLIIIILISTFYHFTPRQYTLLMAAVLFEHFFLLLLLPYDPRVFFVNLLRNVMVIGSTSFTSVMVHRLIYRLTEEVQTLKGFIPICAKCKKIRDDDGFWLQLERYIHEHTDVQFSHGYCPDCFEKAKEQFEKTAVNEELRQHKSLE